MTARVHIPTDGRYKAGCRCDGCKAAHREYTKARRTASLAADNLTHGRRSTYDAGCRCEPCMTARRVAYFTVPTEYQPESGRRRIDGAA